MATPSTGQTLGDGRLQIGTHMPLLAKRYRYLDLLGEGASAQVPIRALCRWKLWQHMHAAHGEEHACIPAAATRGVALCREGAKLGCGPGPQVILAEDTLRPGEPLVAIKILKRQHGYAGLKVWRRRSLPCPGDALRRQVSRQPRVKPLDRLQHFLSTALCSAA